MHALGCELNYNSLATRHDLTFVYIVMNGLETNKTIQKGCRVPQGGARRVPQLWVSFLWVKNSGCLGLSIYALFLWV